MADWYCLSSSHSRRIDDPARLYAGDRPVCPNCGAASAVPAEPFHDAKGRLLTRIPLAIRQTGLRIGERQNLNDPDFPLEPVTRSYVDLSGVERCVTAPGSDGWTVPELPTRQEQSPEPPKRPVLIALTKPPPQPRESQITEEDKRTFRYQRLFAYWKMGGNRTDDPAMAEWLEMAWENRQRNHYWE